MDTLASPRVSSSTSTYERELAALPKSVIDLCGTRATVYEVAPPPKPVLSPRIRTLVIQCLLMIFIIPVAHMPLIGNVLWAWFLLRVDFHCTQPRKGLDG